MKSCTSLNFRPNFMTMTIMTVTVELLRHIARMQKERKTQEAKENCNFARWLFSFCVKVPANLAKKQKIIVTNCCARSQYRFIHDASIRVKAVFLCCLSNVILSACT